jgi:hypothetical protein
MERRRRNEALTREAFDALLAEWARARPAEATIGPVGDYGGKAWLHVRDLGRPFHLNVDTRREGVLAYLAMLEVDPALEWHVVPNARGTPNKGAFGPQLRTIPGFYLYLSPPAADRWRRRAPTHDGQAPATGRAEAPLRRKLAHLARLAPDLPAEDATQQDAERLWAAIEASGAELRFDWVSWQPEAERYVLEPARVDAADLETLRRLLTTHVRKERFCEGHLSAMLQVGHLRRVLQRLGVLVGGA